MPWLIKGNKDASQNLFFVHVPRCGGTSLMHHYNVPKKAMEGRSLGGKLGMTIFFRRYKVLESANFPWKTKTSLICLGLSALSTYAYIVASPYDDYASWMIQDLLLAIATVSMMLFVCLSFLFTAPTIGRITVIRRAYLILIHHILCRFMESIEWCTGTNKTGYMMHLTANKLLEQEYVSKQELQKTTTMAIVRNPYSRMVSVYHYNKFGDAESFETFVQDWYHRMTKPYRETGELDEWYTPCHTIPQFEFTHSSSCHQQDKKKQPLIQCIIKQEELKLLKTRNADEEAMIQSSVSNLPEIVQTALLEMPHTNSRKADKKWYDYYTQETLDMVYEMYQEDFEVFGYSPILEQRSHDLKAPKLYTKQQQQQQVLKEEDSASVTEASSSSSSGSSSSSTEQSSCSDDDRDGELEDVPLGTDDADDSIRLQPTTDSSISNCSEDDSDDSVSRFDIRVLDA